MIISLPLTVTLEVIVKTLVTMSISLRCRRLVWSVIIFEALQIFLLLIFRGVLSASGCKYTESGQMG